MISGRMNFNYTVVCLLITFLLAFSIMLVYENANMHQYIHELETSNYQQAKMIGELGELAFDKQLQIIPDQTSSIVSNISECVAMEVTFNITNTVSMADIGIVPMTYPYRTKNNSMLLNLTNETLNTNSSIEFNNVGEGFMWKSINMTMNNTSIRYGRDTPNVFLLSNMSSLSWDRETNTMVIS